MVQSTEYQVQQQLFIILALLKKVMKFTYDFVNMTGFMESRWKTFKSCKEILIQKHKGMVRRTYYKISRDILLLFTRVSMQQSLHHLKLQTHLKNILKLSSYVREANHIFMKDVKWGKVYVPLHSPWDLWWTNWDSFFFRILRYPSALSFHLCSLLKCFHVPLMLYKLSKWQRLQIQLISSSSLSSDGGFFLSESYDTHEYMLWGNGRFSYL